MSMEITVVDNQVQVILSGSIGEEDALALRDNLIIHIDAERSRIIIDFTNADNISGDGIGMLVSIQQRAVKKGGCVIITGLTEHLRSRFELNRLDKIFELR